MQSSSERLMQREMQQSINSTRCEQCQLGRCLISTQQHERVRGERVCVSFWFEQKAAAQEREELERVKKKGSVSDTARAAGHASNLRLQVRFGTILCVVQNPKRTFACARA